jgi:glutamate/tyrosine decarboxylase-like PLP-dependent enzyme
MPLWADIAAEIADFRRRIRDLPVLPDSTPAALRAELEPRYRFDRAVPLETLTADVMRLLRTHQVHVTHPRYFGLFNPQVREAGIVADTLAALYNAQLAVWSHSPAANELERLALRALAGRIGYDPDAMLAQFTSGGAEANLCAALTALASRFPAWAEEGMAALSTRPAIYVSSESHHSFVKIAKMTGLGTSSVREAPVTADLRLDPAALEALIEADRSAGWSPLLIVGTAGTTAAGIIDPLRELAAVAERTGAWFHADAAWGGGALMSDRLRPLLDGIALADSVTWDAHKWLSVPMGGGMFFCRHPEAVRRAFAAVHTYMPAATAGGTVDSFQVTPQWSRRATGLKVFMSLAELGIGGYATLVEHQAAMGRALRDKLRAAGWTLVADSPLPVVCFTHPDIEAGRLSVDDVVRRVYAGRQAWISPVLLANRVRALRACITSYETEAGDLDVLVEELERGRRKRT